MLLLLSGSLFSFMISLCIGSFLETVDVDPMNAKEIGRTVDYVLEDHERRKSVSERNGQTALRAAETRRTSSQFDRGLVARHKSQDGNEKPTTLFRKSEQKDESKVWQGRNTPDKVSKREGAQSNKFERQMQKLFSMGYCDEVN